MADEFTDWYLAQAVTFINGVLRKPSKIRAVYAILGTDIYHRIPIEQRPDFLALLFGLLPPVMEIPVFDAFPTARRFGALDDLRCSDDVECEATAKPMGKSSEPLS